LRLLRQAVGRDPGTWRAVSKAPSTPAPGLKENFWQTAEPDTALSTIVNAKASAALSSIAELDVEILVVDGWC